MVEYESEGIVIAVCAEMLSLIRQYAPVGWFSVGDAPARLGLVSVRSVANMRPRHSGLAARG